MTRAYLRSWRREDIAHWVGVVLLINLLVGAAIVTVLAQHDVEREQEIRRQTRTEDSVKSQDARIKVFEDMKIGPQLAVLNDMADHVRWMERMITGEFATMVGAFVLFIFNSNRNRDRRDMPRLIAEK